MNSRLFLVPWFSAIWLTDWTISLFLGVKFLIYPLILTYPLLVSDSIMIGTALIGIWVRHILRTRKRGVTVIAQSLRRTTRRLFP